MIAEKLQQPALAELVCQFLYNEIYAANDLTTNNVPLCKYPEFSGHISIYYSTTATFYAPSELSGIGSMHQETIRSNPTWWKSYPQYDTVLVNTDPTAVGIQGMLVTQVKLFLSFLYDNNDYDCALVEWFECNGEAPDPVMGLWKVKPEVWDAVQSTAIVHIDCIMCAVHLIGVYLNTTILVDLPFYYALDAFETFYINKYADYHSHKTLF